MRFQLLSLALSAVSAASAACLVPQIIFTSLTGPFVLVADSTNTAIDGKILTISGNSLAVLDSNVANQLNMTLANGILSLSDAPHKSAFTQTSGQLEFFAQAAPASDNNLQLAGRYACSAGESVAHVELYPTSTAGSSFCAAIQDDGYVVFVKTPDAVFKDCLSFSAVVQEQ